MIRDTFAESPGDYRIQYDLAGNHDDGTECIEEKYIHFRDSTSSDVQGVWQ